MQNHPHLPLNLPPRTLRKTYEIKNPNPEAPVAVGAKQGDGLGSGSIEDGRMPTIGPDMEGLGDSEEFKAAQAKMAAAKDAFQKNRIKAQTLVRDRIMQENDAIKAKQESSKEKGE